MSRSMPAQGGVEKAPWGRFVQIDDSEGNGLVLQQSARR
jgi:predicted enzyme related to lactoylglutathione lyase